MHVLGRIGVQGRVVVSSVYSIVTPTEPTFLIVAVP